MFQRTIDGIVLRFHLAGINNQNFLMRDEQTGTYWQQITGLAIAGPLAGRRLPLVSADELTFALWKSEQPGGTVLTDARPFAKYYAREDWDREMAKVPTVISYAQAGLKPRDLMLGAHSFGASRAFPFTAILKEKLVQDWIGSEPLLLVVGEDNLSVRAFQRRIPGVPSLPNFYRILDGQKDPQTGARRSRTLFMDAETGSEWNFKGCAISGKLAGRCLSQIDVIKDYWFDWRNYNPETTVYGIKRKIQ